MELAKGQVIGVGRMRSGPCATSIPHPQPLGPQPQPPALRAVMLAEAT